jgi:hypothetical protein
MSARIREDGTIVCAAMYPPAPNDYQEIDDRQLYDLVRKGRLIASPTHLHAEGCDGSNCKGKSVGGSGSPLCGDGLWFGACGEKFDLYPADPGHLVRVCLRAAHSKRAWHKTLDETFAWK